MIQVDVKNNSFSFQQQALMFLECKVWLDWEMVSYFFMSKSTDFSTLKERSICFSGPWPHITIILQVSVSIAIFFSKSTSSKVLSHHLSCLGLRTVYRMDVQIKIH